MSKLPQLPVPFRKQGQQIAYDGCTYAMCDYYSSEQLQQFQRETVEACAELLEKQHMWISNVAASALIRNMQQGECSDNLRL